MAGMATAAAAQNGKSGSTEPLRLCVFSKHFQWTSWEETAALAAEIGFDGVDLTVRKGGHVLPERVELDLPKAVAAIRKAGLLAPMITADIVDARTPHAEAILKTASGLGIHYYRWGGLTYSYDRDMAAQLDEMRPRVVALAALNEKHRICSMYHTHSGLRQVGAPIWDLWTLMKDLDPRWIGINYDIGHATVEGGFGGWIDSAHLVQRHMRGVALKDFAWGKNAKGVWAPQWCAVGEGMVNFPAFFEILKAARFSGPLQMHFEYPALGAAHTGGQLDIPKEKFMAMLRKDLAYVKGQMRQAGLV